MKYEYTHFLNENVAPKGATRIVVMETETDEEGNKNPVKEVCSIPSSRFGMVSRPSADPLYSFGLVSDCHTYDKATNHGGNNKLRNALTYFQSQGCIMTIGCGDFTQTGFYRRNDSSTTTITVTGTTVIPNRPDFTVPPLTVTLPLLAL